MWVGIATTYTVLGNRIAPAFVDWYLARTGVKAQQTDQDAPRWGSNVFEARDEDVDRGAHGPFGDKASDRDPVSAVARNRLAALGAVTAVAAGAGTLLRWYVLHVLMLPFVIVIFMAVHFWRVRKDGGLSGPL